MKAGLAILVATCVMGLGALGGVTALYGGDTAQSQTADDGVNNTTCAHPHDHFNDGLPPWMDSDKGVPDMKNDSHAGNATGPLHQMRCHPGRGMPGPVDRGNVTNATRPDRGNETWPGRCNQTRPAWANLSRQELANMTLSDWFNLTLPGWSNMTLSEWANMTLSGSPMANAPMMWLVVGHGWARHGGGHERGIQG